VLQHTPLAVTAEPPSVLIFPPDVAVVLVTEDASVVVSEGGLDRVVKINSFPYDVPALFTA